MQVCLNNNIHNRFDIEVIRDGKVIQTGYAENIVLNKMWDTLCNRRYIFDNIYFGRGEGVLSPSRTTLFSQIGKRAAIIEETVKTLPVGKVVRKITLAPEEFVGETITEVGIGDGSFLHTHALLLDSEGAPLNLTKTALDVVIIYATLFVTLDVTSTGMYLHPAETNSLLNYLLTNGGFNPYIGVSNVDGESMGRLTQSTSKTPTSTRDVPNRKEVFKTRYAINEANIGGISNVYLKDIVSAILPNPTIYPGLNIQDKTIGVGDGVTKDFIVPFRKISDMTVNSNGAPTTGYTSSTMPGLSLVMGGRDQLEYGLTDDEEWALGGSDIYKLQHMVKAEKVYNIDSTGLRISSLSPSGTYAIKIYNGAERFDIFKQTAGVWDFHQTINYNSGWLGLFLKDDTLLFFGGHVPFSGSGYHFTQFHLVDGLYVQKGDPKPIGIWAYAANSNTDDSKIAVYGSGPNYKILHLDEITGEYVPIPTTLVSTNSNNVEGGAAAFKDNYVVLGDGTVYEFVDGAYIKIPQEEGIISSTGLLATTFNDWIVLFGVPTSRFARLENGQLKITPISIPTNGAGHSPTRRIGNFKFLMASYYSSPYYYYHYYHLTDGYTLISFDTPPAIGEALTVDLFSACIPKSEDYVLDITIEIRYGEGV